MITTASYQASVQGFVEHLDVTEQVSWHRLSKNFKVLFKMFNYVIPLAQIQVFYLVNNKFENLF